jgi:hypothetical protein
LVAREHALERRDTAFVERGAGVLVQECNCVFVRPRVSVDPR